MISSTTNTTTNITTPNLVTTQSINSNSVSDIITSGASGGGQCPIHNPNNHQYHHSNPKTTTRAYKMDNNNQQGRIICDNNNYVCSCGSGGGVGGMSGNAGAGSNTKKYHSSSNSNQQQQQSSLSMDRAAFLLIRIKKVFQKKRKKNQAIKSGKLNMAGGGGSGKQKPPMLRARTLPAIITPALNILQAQLQNQQQQKHGQNQIVNINVEAEDTDGQVFSNNNLNNNNRADSYDPLLSAIQNSGGNYSGICQRSSDFLQFVGSGSSGGFNDNNKNNCNCPNCTNGQSYSPRHSVSSNSSAGSQKDTSIKTKNSSFQKLTKLWNNNSNRILNTSTYGSLWCKGGGGSGYGGHVSSSSFNQDVWSSNIAGISQDNLPRFSWNMVQAPNHQIEQPMVINNNNNANNNQMKRSGSIDSLLDVHQMQCDWQEWQDSIMATDNGHNHHHHQMPSIITMDNNSLGVVHSGTSSPSHLSNYLTPYSQSSSPLGGSSKSGSNSKSRLSISAGQGITINNNTNISGVGVDTTSSSGFGLKKSERKKLEKLSKFNFDQQALFLAVENEHLDRTRMIIESANVNINSLNSDGFTILDISLMLLNLPMIKYLQSRGAREGDLFGTRASREAHLQTLLNEAQRCLMDLTVFLQRQMSNVHGSATTAATTPTTATNSSILIGGSIGGGGQSSTQGGSVLSSALVKEKERQLMFWQRRLKLLQRFKKGFDLLQIPPPPLSVHVQVCGADSLLVHYYPPIRLQDRRNIITKYKIEWSMDHFETVLGFIEVTNVSTKHELTIDHLEPGQCYQVRIASGNCKGYSEYCYPLMNELIPSTWRSIDKRNSQMDKRIVEIDQLFSKIVEWRQQQLFENNSSSSNNSSNIQRKSIELDQGLTMTGSGGSQSSTSSIVGGNLSQTVSNTLGGQQKKVRKSFKNFFGATNKFQKIIKRSGVYFASFIYHQQRVLVTNEEVLPLIEIDDIYPSTLQNDFYWLLKISCAWDDVKMFRKEMEKSNQSSSAIHFRIKILLAIEQMQTSLGLIDLGKLFYRPLRDQEGTVVLCSIRCLDDPKMVSCLSVRWMPMTKLQKRIAQQQQQQQHYHHRESSPVNMFQLDSSQSLSSVVGNESIGQSSSSSSSSLMVDLIFSTLDEMIHYYQACNRHLPPGLYVAYVKLKSSVDMMSLMVTKSHPNILPYAKMRDNAHVSQKEWAAIRMCLKFSNSNNSNLNQSTNTNTTNDAITSLAEESKPLKRHGSNNIQLQLQLSTENNCNNKPETDSSGKKNIIEQSSQCSSPQMFLGFGGGGGGPITTPLSSPITSPNFTEDFLKLALDQKNQLQQPKQQQLEMDISDPVHTDNQTAIDTSTNNVKLTQHNKQHLTFSEKLSFQQLLKFLQALCQTSLHLLEYIGINDDKLLNSHRIYTVEVIELDSKVSLILLLPPPDEVCSVTQYEDVNSSMDSVNTDIIYLPLKIFELIHMNTYQRHFTGQYWRLSALLELDITAAQQAQREAFSSDEMLEAKQRLNQLLEFQQQLDEHCRSMRWIMDVVGYARDKQTSPGISLSRLQYCLSMMDKQSWEEVERDPDRLIPVISFGEESKNNNAQKDNQNNQNNLNPDTNGSNIVSMSNPEHLPKINIQSECSSTPSSPPSSTIISNSIDIPLARIGRRKSRDDSYLDEHHRAMNHFQSLAHQRFHHNYHSCNNGCDQDEDDLKDHQDLENNLDLDKMSRVSGMLSKRSASIQPSTTTIASTSIDFNQSTEMGCLQTESSYSLNDSVNDFVDEPTKKVGDLIIKDNIYRSFSISKLGTNSSTRPNETTSFPMMESISPLNYHLFDTTSNEDIDRTTNEQPSLALDENDCLLDHHSAPIYEDLSEVSTKAPTATTVAGFQVEPYRPLSRISHKLIPETKIEEEEATVAVIEEGQIKENDQGFREDNKAKSLNQPKSLGKNMFFNDNFEDVLRKTNEIKLDHPQCCSKPDNKEIIQSNSKNMLITVIGLSHNRSSHKSQENNRRTTRRKASSSYQNHHSHQSCCEECQTRSSSSTSTTSNSSSSCDSCCSISTISSYDDDQDTKRIQIPILASENSNSSSTGSSKIINQSNISTKKTLQIHVIQKCCLPGDTVIHLQIPNGTRVVQIIQAIIEYSFNKKNKRKKEIIAKQERNNQEIEQNYDNGNDPNQRSKNHSKYQMENYSLLALYANNIKHLNGYFQIDNLQSPWNDAKLCLKYQRA